MLDAGKRDNGNPIDSETRAYMIYSLVESGSSDAHYSRSFTLIIRSCSLMARRFWPLALKGNAVTNRAREIASGSKLRPTR